ncbi:MAG: hypothetical protein ACXAEX_14115 [Promethearchaeota archaeon]|jgi:hypothetical protein
MSVLNLIKIITALVTVVITFIAGFIELRLNQKDWLNRWFASFFFSVSLGFLAYSIYHLTGINEVLTESVATIAQIFFNVFPVSLVMTVFVLEKSDAGAMNLKYFGSMMVLLILMSVGYLIWHPELDEVEEWNVNTQTEPVWWVFVNALRIGMAIFVALKYAMITRRTEPETKKRIQWFFVGIIIVIIGLITNLIGGLFEIDTIEVSIEIFALILFNIGGITIVKGFLI